LIFCFITAMLTLNADFFAVKDITVSGCHNLSPSQVISYSEIKTGERIFFINKNSVVENLKKSPWITSAKVKTSFPSKVIIEVEENTPAAMVPYMGSMIMIDKECVVLEIHGKSDTISLVVTGLNLVPPIIGQPLKSNRETDILALKSLLTAIEVNRLTPEVCEVNVEDLDDIIIYFLGSIEARIGNVMELNKKLSKIPYILEDIRKNNRSGGYIDLKTGSDPIYRKE
jgi:cell division protein FtsQ